MNAFLGFVEGSGAVRFRTSAVVFNLNIQRCPQGQSVLAIDFALAFMLEFLLLFSCYGMNAFIGFGGRFRSNEL